MFSVFLTAGDAETLTRVLFCLLVPTFVPDHLWDSNAEVRESRAREYFQERLAPALAEVMQQQEGSVIALSREAVQQFRVDIGCQRQLSLLTGSERPEILSPIAKAWVKVGIDFSVYYAADAERDLGKSGSTPTQRFYQLLEHFATGFAG